MLSNTTTHKFIETIDIDDNEKSIKAYQYLYSGDKQIDFIGDWNEFGYLWVILEEPTPFCLLGIYSDIEEGA